jgi:hypothetical protein
VTDNSSESTHQQPSTAATQPIDKPVELTRERLEEMISDLHPKREVASGIRFLMGLLKEKGVKGVLGFVAKASNSLIKSDGLDLAYDFAPLEKEIFNKSRLNIMDRRNFLRTAGWIIPGAISLTNGAAKFGDQATRIFSSSEASHNDQKLKESTPERNVFEHTSNFIEKNLIGLEYSLIGAALINEGLEKWIEIKLEQVADAVVQLDEGVKAEKSKSLSQ